MECNICIFLQGFFLNDADAKKVHQQDFYEHKMQF